MTENKPTSNPAKLFWAGMTRDDILKTLEEKGEDWVIAALIEGSIGYHSPAHARRIIENVKKGEIEDYCERCTACFRRDLLAMVKHDIDGFRHVSQAKVERLMKAVPQLEKLSDVQQMTFSLMYPTAGV
jgi:hypothetical protein